MTINKRAKNTRLRGSKTHGGGSMKKRRGAGHRGGRGKAGSGKRGDGKKPMYWKDLKYFGKKKFTVPGKQENVALTVHSLESELDTLVSKKLASLEKNLYKINLTEQGIYKLLGTGVINKKVEVTVDKASEKAISKVEKAGGKVILPSQE